MATTSGDSTAVPTQDTPPAHTIIPAPIATNEQHVCFICLQNENDTPNATWVNPCPCSLEAHEECMLRWIAEMETGPRRSSKAGLKCPACKGFITVEEPYDPVVALRDRFHQRYSRVSPYILAGLVAGGAGAGAASYGFAAASIFAGQNTVEGWLRVWSRHQLPSTLIKVWALSAIGPSLVVMRWLPSLGTVLLLPFSALYGATLVAHDDLPTWPPSPRWAVAMMPLVQLTYAYLLHDLFGPFERRLNRALRGLPPTDDDAAPGAEAAPAAAAGGEAAGHNEDEADGAWGAVGNLGRAALGLFLGWPAGVPVDVEVEIAEEFEFRIGGDNDQDEDDMGRILEEQDLVGGEDGLQLLAEGVAAQLEDHQHPENEEQPEIQPLAEDALAGPAEQQQQQQQQPEPQPAAAQQAVPQAEAVAQQNQPAQNQNNQNQRRNNDAAPGETSYFRILINNVVTSLLFPAISYGMGELIRAAVPKDWVTRRAALPMSLFGRSGPRTPRGLLQEQWGRSLVGGCLFVVLRDAITLYTKYRRVQVKSMRRVKNVEKRVGRGAPGGT